MSAFDKLAPFIQDYIYKNRWQELREIQVAACDVIFNTENNLLLATPTASGKTEAAFLPVITQLHKNPSASVGVLYIAPLKALINDQFTRMEELLEQAYIPVTKWHGDASQTAKNKLLKKPSGVMQITPESLEAMLMKRKLSVVALFSDLRFIIIDEVHNFIQSDRGVQLSSVLERIQALIQKKPRRIGLSATLGDFEIAEKWLSSGTGKKCETPRIDADRRKASLMLTHYYTNSKTPDDETWTPFYDFLYSITRGKKSIIFSNSRSEVETNINRLKLIAESKKERDVFHVHHGNISSEIREYAEHRMRSADSFAVTGATVTLELGIDLGDLERIVQTGSPHSVSSLAQRLGRSGRRSGVSKMCFVFSEDLPAMGRPFYKTINWQLIKCIALIELYRENWLEPLRISKFPYNILAHQTLSVLYGYGDAEPKILAQKLLGTETFSHINQDDYRKLLRHMLEIKLLEKTPEGKLMIGAKGEWLTNSFEFYSVFENVTEFSVRENEREIGTLYRPLPVGEKFVLSGSAWEVTEVDFDKRAIYVKYVGGKSSVNWEGTGPTQQHTKVLKKMRDVLVSSDSYGYLSASAAARLEEIRATVRMVGVFQKTSQPDIVNVSPNRYLIFPWLGTRALNALKLKLAEKGFEVLGNDSTDVMLMVAADNPGAIEKALNAFKTDSTDQNLLKIPDDIPNFGKYSDCVPPALAKKQFLDDWVDFDELRRELRGTEAIGSV